MDTNVGYLSLGLKAVILKGYEQGCNPDRDDEQAMELVDERYAAPDFLGLS